MPATAVQLPFVREIGQRAGRKLWRKQVLPVGTIEHPAHGPLHFTAARLAEIRERYLAGAMDAVPFVLVNDANLHSDDPTRARGQVRGLELTARGLDAIVETTEDGSQLLTDSPELPVSVRLKTPEVGPFAGKEVLAHLAGTYDPVATGLSPWQPIDASDDTEILDLTREGCYTSLSVAEEQTTPPGSTSASNSVSETLSAPEVGRVRAFLQRLGGREETPPAGNPPAEASQEQIDQALNDLIASIDENSTESSPLPDPAATAVAGETPATATLSNPNPEVVELTQRVERAEVRVGSVELANRLNGYLEAGVPPTLIKAAKDQLLGDSDAHKAIAIDFANQREHPAAKALFAALDAAKGTIDFSEQGSSSTSTEDEGRKAVLDAWEKHSG